MQVLKVGVPDVGYKSFAPQGEAPGFEFPLYCELLCQGRGFYSKIVSRSPLPFCYQPLFPKYLGFIQPVFSIFSEEVPCVAGP